MNKIAEVAASEFRLLVIHARNLLLELNGRETPKRQKRLETALAVMALVIANNECYLSSHHKADYSAHAFFNKLSCAAILQLEKILCDSGYVTRTMGHHARFAPESGDKTIMTEIAPTPKFEETELFKAANQLQSKSSYVECDFKRDRVIQRQIWVPEHLNEWLSKNHHIDYQNKRQNITLRRISQEDVEDGEGELFNSYGMGGRFYSTGKNGAFHFQGLSKEERGRIRIDGQSVVGLDYKCLQPSIAYAYLLKKGLDGDAYAFHSEISRRDLNKALWMYFAYKKTTPDNLHRALRRKYEHIEEEDELFGLLHDFFSNPEKWRKEYLSLFINRHKELIQPINGFTNSLSLIFQNRDSDLMNQILRTCFDTDIPVLPVHDECICRAADAPKVHAIMLNEYKIMFGQVIEIKQESGEKVSAIA